MNTVTCIIPCSFEDIQSKSKEAFKRIVKVKSKKFALERLTKKQSTHSKMENLVYKELKMQRYMLNDELNLNQKKILFKFRMSGQEWQNFEKITGEAEPRSSAHYANVHLDGK